MKTTIATLISSLTALQSAANDVSALGLNVLVTVDAGDKATALVTSAPAPQCEASVASAPIAAASPVVTQVAASAPTAEAAEPEAEAAPAAAVEKPFDVDARLAALAETSFRCSRTRKTSGGYRKSDTGDITLTIGSVDELDDGSAIGFINVYKESVGVDVHRTLEKAKQYASPKVIGQLPVLAA